METTICPIMSINRAEDDKAPCVKNCSWYAGERNQSTPCCLLWSLNFRLTELSLDIHNIKDFIKKIPTQDS